MLDGHRMMILTVGRSGDYFEVLPRLIFHEVVDREITRVIEIYPDGHTGIARSQDLLELGGACVPEHPDPEPSPPDDNSLVTIVISKEEFDRYWANALQRVERETGVRLET